MRAGTRSRAASAVMASGVGGVTGPRDAGRPCGGPPGRGGGRPGRGPAPVGRTGEGVTLDVGVELGVGVEVLGAGRRTTSTIGGRRLLRSAIRALLQSRDDDAPVPCL